MKIMNYKLSAIKGIIKDMEQVIEDNNVVDVNEDWVDDFYRDGMIEIKQIIDK